MLILDKVYNPKVVEEKCYYLWLENGLFHSIPVADKEPFVIVIPPPNITGALHIGHALNNTLQDVIIRYYRMKGYNALWVPGTDHGGIATQNVVEKILLSEGTTRQEIGREKFLQRMWQWRKETGDTILTQLRKLGCSCDWVRTKFTMDENYSKAVLFAFVQLYHQGLIYRGKRIVNWCPRCQTALADIEVEHKEIAGKLWYIKYPFKETNIKHITVATTRPETMLGDTAVAVNPEDVRYRNYIGKKVILPLMDREIEIIADELVEPEFGTGAVKITPSHDPVDFEIAQKKNLPFVTVIDTAGKMTSCGKYTGLSREACREKVIEDLKLLDLLYKVDDYTYSVGTCYRCHTIIEPLISEQWFLNVKPLAEKAIKAINSGEVKFYPESWCEPCVKWLENIHDWCLSRQNWWGHRIPIYYCVSELQRQEAESQNNITTSCPLIVSINRPEKCSTCGNTNLSQDPDVLDTWFSSALWPFGVFGWPGDLTTRTANYELSYYYPTSVLVTGYEILYLWVARMIMMGLHFLNKVPFREVYVHGIVRDVYGKKMSKSLGNVIDPLEIMDKYGTDALRFSLTSASTPGRDLQLYEENFASARNFANKIWNVARFIFLNLDGYDSAFKYDLTDLPDRWLFSEFNVYLDRVNKSMARYELAEVANTMYEFVWKKFCDWYIEISKIGLNNKENIAIRKTKQKIIVEIFSGILKILHPILPFITEEIWQMLYTNKIITERFITNSQWPKNQLDIVDYKAIAQMNALMQIVTLIRNIRSEMLIPLESTVDVAFNIKSDESLAVVQENISWIKQLAKIDKIVLGKEIKKPESCSTGIVSDIEIFVTRGVDIDIERQRLMKVLAKLNNEILFYENKLKNEQFVAKAKKNIVETIKVKWEEKVAQKKKLEEVLRWL